MATGILVGMSGSEEVNGDVGIALLDTAKSGIAMWELGIGVWLRNRGLAQESGFGSGTGVLWGVGELSGTWDSGLGSSQEPGIPGWGASKSCFSMKKALFRVN